MLSFALISDVRRAAGQLLKRPGFAAVLVTTLALGIGATTAVFSVVRGVLLLPLPYPESDRLVMVWSRFPSMDLMEFPSSGPEYLDYREASTSYEELGAYVTGAATLTGDGSPVRIEGTLITASLLRLLGVQAEVGRVFGGEEDRPGADDVILLSHGLWQRRYGGDRTVVGRLIQVDGRPMTVLGVMPAGFDFPTPETEAWTPLALDPGDPGGRASHYLDIVGRLAPGVTESEAEAELAGLLGRWAGDQSPGHMWNAEFHPAHLVSLREQIVGDSRPALLVLFGAVGVVLLIACANVANLLLVRGEGRQRELAIRTAMGADRRAILRQLLVESLVAAAAGGAAGLALAWAGIRGLLALAPEGIPRLESVSLDGAVLAFSAGITLLAGVLFGLAPGVQALRSDVHDSLRDEARGTTAGRGRFRLRQILVVSEMAMAVVLLVAAGLLIQSFWRLHHTDPGFRTEGVLQARVALPASAYPQPEDVTAFYRDLLPRLGPLPGVEAVAAVRRAPLAGALPPNDIEFESGPAENEADAPLNADIQVVTPGYFEAMGIPLVRGRGFTESDHAGSEAVAVVNRTLAERFFPGENPLDRRVRQPGENEWARIVGVVGDVRHLGLDEEPRAELYLLHAQSPRTWYPVRAMSLLLRTAGDPASMTSVVRRTVQALDPNLPLYEVSTIEETVSDSTARERFSMLLQGAFALVALVLAAVGIYGVIAYSVAARTQEIGIRMALGADRGTILGMVVRQGMGLAAAATGLGLAGALVGGRVLASLLFGVSPRDPVTLSAVAALLLAVALLASWLPARRAASVDPQVALRHE